MEIQVIPDWPNFLLQLLNTVIMYFIVRHLAWKPFLKLKESRQHLATAMISEAETLKGAAVKMQEEAESNVGKSRTEAREIIEKSKEMATVLHDEIIADAKEIAKSKISRAEEEIALSKKAAYADFYESVVSLAVESAEKLLEKEINPQIHEKMLQDFLGEVGGIGE